MTDTVTSADRGIAEEIATYHHGGVLDLPNGVEQIGSGTHRIVYVDHDTDTVYKIAKEGHDGANVDEHRNLTHWREQGADWAPPADLYDVVVDGQWGEVACTVIAMPYLPEDGTVDHDGVIIAAAGDFNPANVHAHNGRLWLIDAGGM